MVVRLEVVRGRIDSGCSYSGMDNRFHEAVKIVFEPETLKMALACLIKVRQESTPRHFGKPTNNLVDVVAAAALAVKRKHASKMNQEARQPRRPCEAVCGYLALPKVEN